MQKPQSNDELERLKHAYLVTFSSEAGKVVLADLHATYSGTALSRGDPYSTHYNVGAQDVIKAIQSMIDLALNEETHNAD